MKRILKHTFSLLNIDHAKLGEKWNYKNVISPYFRLYYIDQGIGELSNIEKSLKLEPGYLYIIPSFTLCNLFCESYLHQYFVHFFEESPDGISLFSNHRSIFQVKASEIDIINFKRLLAINPGRGINRSDNPKIYEKDIYYKEYQKLNEHQNFSVYLETQGILLQLISRFLTPLIFKQRKIVQTPTRIMDAISYISLHLNKELNVSLLANRSNLNTDYFSRIFKQYTGIGPMDYIHSKRIERAQYLMTTTNLEIAEIATMTGFENVFYFSKIFKKVTSISPGQYKKQIALN